MNNNKWVIPAAPERLNNIALSRTFRAGGRQHTFVKTSDGGVFRLSPQRSIDLSASYDSNATVRREVCKLTGQKMADLQADIKKCQEKLAAKERRVRVANLRNRAALMGYRLVKIKAGAL